jgi:hypothetical protein
MIDFSLRKKVITTAGVYIVELDEKTAAIQVETGKYHENNTIRLSLECNDNPQGDFLNV